MKYLELRASDSLMKVSKIVLGSVFFRDRHAGERSL
jgi:hypothetical protein